jgi:hypothetical protein
MACSSAACTATRCFVPAGLDVACIHITRGESCQEWGHGNNLQLGSRLDDIKVQRRVKQKGAKHVLDRLPCMPGTSLRSIHTAHQLGLAL